MDTDYKVLYRKYRPKNFNEVVGQKFTVNMLKNAIINDKLSHAYIFTGPRGTGKTSTAKIFAKTINCEHVKDGIACGECETCKNINNNADIIEIDAASNNGVDEIRELINNVKIAPSFSKYKVYIIDEVHMLSQSAFNALLLTLEEPPAHIIFIFATTNIENVPITILSRCQRYDFKKIEEEDIINHLQLVCDKEKIEITEDAIKEIAYLSDGGLRDALSILNQLSTSNSSISLETVLENYGSVSLVQIKNIIQAILSNEYNTLKEIFDNLSKSSLDYKTFIKKMVDEMFSVAISSKNGGDNRTYSHLKNIVFELNDLINKINIHVDPFLLIFMILVNYISVEDSYEEKESAEKVEVTPKVIEKKSKEKMEEPVVNGFEKKLPVLENSLEDNEYINNLISVRINNCFAEADKKYLFDFKKKWNKFVNHQDLTESLKNFLIDCEIVLASPSINIAIHSQSSVAELFNQNLNEIEQKYKEIMEIPLKFVALSEENWNLEKKEYVKKIKAGDSYQLLEEPVMEQKKVEETPLDGLSSSSVDDIMNIFDASKLEIK